METTPGLDFWWRFAAMLTLGTSVIVLIAFALQTVIASAVWRRTIWQACALGVLTLLAVELTGGSRVFARWMKAPQEVTLTNIAPQDRGFSVTISELPEPPSHPSSVLAPDRTPHSWWPGILWLAGSALLIGRMLFVRFVFLLHGSRRRAADDRQLLARVQELSVRLRIRRRVRVFEIDELRGPIAFGTLRPAIGLPKDFSTFTSREQDAMLIHELAHLAARDPVWYSLVDILAALMWWHPIIWWVRRRLHMATEAAADESCVLVEDGPNVLAEALVQLGGRLLERQRLGLLGIGGNGFRSDLGRRVERLLRLSGREWRPMSRVRSWAAKAAGSSVLVGITLCCCAWMIPDKQPSRPNEWQYSLVGRALAAMRHTVAVRDEIERGDKHTFIGAQSVGAIPNRGDRRMTAGQESRDLTEASVNELVLYTRTFKIDIASFAKAVGEGGKVREELPRGEDIKFPPAFDLPRPVDPDRPLPDRRQPKIRHLDLTDDPRDRINKIREFFSLQGIDLAPPKSIFWSDRRGVLMVRATLPDLTNIEKAIHTINLRPPNLAAPLPGPVRDKAEGNPSFPELSGSDALLPNRVARAEPALHTRTFKVEPVTFMKRLQEATAGRLPAKDEGIPLHTAAQLDAMRRLFHEAGVELTPPKGLFWNDRLGMVMVRAPLEELDVIEQIIQVLNVPPPQVTIEVKIAEMPEAAVKQLGLDWLGTTVTATISTNQPRNPFVDTNAITANYAMVLTDPQYRVILRALEQRTGVDVLSLPKVTTLSARQAQIKTVSIKSVVTGTAEKTDQSGVFDLVITQHECGPIIDAVPLVRADGYTIDLTVITTSREFLGYESTSETVKVLGDDGKIGSAPKPLPEFRVRQAVATPTIWDGQTFAMGMGKFEGRERVAFVTVTIIDPAGNRVHSEEDGEFRTRGIPPQRKVSDPNVSH